MIDGHELNRTLTVWRPAVSSDSLGGSTVTVTQVGTVRARVSQPSAAEQIEAQRAGAALLMAVYLPPGADVRRGDELRGDDDRLRVRYVIEPSEPEYLRADCEQIQSEGDRED